MDKHVLSLIIPLYGSLASRLAVLCSCPRFRLKDRHLSVRSFSAGASEVYHVEIKHETVSKLNLEEEGATLDPVSYRTSRKPDGCLTRTEYWQLDYDTGIRLVILDKQLAKSS
ncbi:hypothetical protein ARMSODRAFT_430294 [Armillaria solidipes]|uniref:Uncharacterized protein n=1 Tax=Armillaria solidipes TaxID=1076256 RepID=A0A2H3B3Y1_9AGAR|nr:hypothetical protein ARMSODRAFT_430294 [Armillaria solidipes]